MSTTALISSFPASPPGSISKLGGEMVETIVLGSSVGITGQFSAPLKYDVDGKLILMALDDSPALLAGLLVRDYLARANIYSTLFGKGIADPADPQGMLTLGYMSLTCVGTAPVRGEIVYMRLLSGVSIYPVGSYAASALDATFVGIPNMIWITSGLTPEGTATARIIPQAIGGGAGDLFAGPGITLTGFPGPQTISVNATAFVLSLFSAVDAAAFRAALGLGTLALQNANAVNITGGTLDSVTITNSTIS